MFDLEKFLTSTPLEVNAQEITFKDMRTGQTFKRTIYRPGNAVNFAKLGTELSRYGYRLTNIGKPGNVPGRMNWSEIWGQFFQSTGIEEEDDDRPQY